MIHPEKEAYVKRILNAYLHLPDTPNRINRLDRKLAEELFDRNLSPETVENAMLLAVARRHAPKDQLPLGPIRSLNYFLPIIQELISSPLPKSYLDYLKRTIDKLSGSL